MEEDILERVIHEIKTYGDLDGIEDIRPLGKALENLIARNKELEEYKKYAELTKISCCTAQNCEALNNAIKNGLENENLKKQLKDMEKEFIEVCEKLRNSIPKSKVREKIEEANKEIKQMEQDDIGIGFTLGNRWSDLKAKVKGWEELLQEGDK